MNFFQASIKESILIKISSKNIDRKNIFLRGSKQVQIGSMKLCDDNMGTLKTSLSMTLRNFLIFSIFWAFWFL